MTLWNIPTNSLSNHKYNFFYQVWTFALIGVKQTHTHAHALYIETSVQKGKNHSATYRLTGVSSLSFVSDVVVSGLCCCVISEAAGKKVDRKKGKAIVRQTVLEKCR